MLPKTSLTEGHDTTGKPVKLGDVDTDGYPVNYIEPEGLGHESHKAAELSRASGEFDELTRQYRAGELEAPPSPNAVVTRLCHPEYRVEAVQFMREQHRIWRILEAALEADPTLFQPRFKMPDVARDAPFGG